MDSKEIFKMEKRDNIGIVYFDVFGEAMNTWTKDAFASFSKVLDTVERDSGIKGVIFISAKPYTFFAGANLKIVEQLKTEEQKRSLVTMFQDHFNRLSRMKAVTLAAINGHCLGGGLEFALACKARIIKESKTTLIGLPETNVGIIPAAGGTQRLPRLIGYPAIELIVNGTMLSAKDAFQLGIADKLVSADGDLLKEAMSFMTDILSGSYKLKRSETEWSKLEEEAERVLQNDVKKRGRELPAPRMVIKSIVGGVRLPLEKGLEHEKECGVQILLTNEAAGNINTFFLKTMTDRPTMLMVKGFKPKQVKKAAVIGFGEAGRALAIEILKNLAIPVVVKDIVESHHSGREYIKNELINLEKKKKLKTSAQELMSLVSLTDAHSDDLKEADIVFEAVFESENMKKEVYYDLCKTVKKDATIASCTSTLSVTDLSRYIDNPGRFCGYCTINQISKAQIVEIVRGRNTNIDTVDNMLNFTEMLRKRAIVSMDARGGVVNRLLCVYLTNALECLKGRNSIEEIDGAMKEFGMPMGPFKYMETIGIDKSYDLLSGLDFETDILKKMVHAGRTGLKNSGKGFFLKEGGVDSEVYAFVGGGRNAHKTGKEIQLSNLTAIVKSGNDMLEKKIVEDPRLLDVAMIWGIGFPSEKGGPMKWSDLTGLSRELFHKSFYR